MKKITLAIGSIAWIAFVFAKGARAEDATQNLTVEQRLSILEQKYEKEQEAAAQSANNAAVVTAGKDGFWIRSIDHAYQLHVGGYIQADHRIFLSDDRQTGTNQFLIRRARLIVEGSVNKFADFRLVPDFAGGVATLVDAYFDLKASSALKFRAGKYKPAVGLEVLQSDSNLLFVERSFVSGLLPSRDVGVQLFGDIANGAVSYAAGLSNGGVDGGTTETDTNDEKEYSGRIWAQPFKNSRVESLRELGIGLAGTSGNQLGSTTSQLLASAKTEGQQIFFSYSTTTYSNGRHTRISPQFYWYAGRVGFLGEYAASAQDVNRSSPAQAARLINTAWQLSGSYVLTGEKASYKGVTPRNGIDHKGFGALEIGARYEEFRADPDSFPTYASTSASVSKASSYTGGINWYLTSNLKWVGNYENTRFSGGGAGNTDRPREQAVLTRLQVVF